MSQTSTARAQGISLYFPWINTASRPTSIGALVEAAEQRVESDFDADRTRDGEACEAVQLCEQSYKTFILPGCPHQTV